MEATILPTPDVSYPATNSPPSTTHLALNVCEALHCPSLRKGRDVKDKDRRMSQIYNFFSGKQLTSVMWLELRKQKPLSDALDGLYLLCKEHMLQTQRDRGHAGTLWKQASS